jgi:vacuolar-type H+-ATPase subunit I/STV1
MQGSDQAALAASTAQGWAYALNTVARPAPEHLEAAQEALTALGRADRDVRWAGVADTLKEALETARMRVDGGVPEVTVAQLAEAVGRLRQAGLVQRPDAALVQAVRDDGALARIEELEEELEDANERAALTDAELRRQIELRDRFERERDQERRARVSAEAMTSTRADSLREDSRRAGYLWTLAQLGMNAPGFDEMSTDDLRAEAAAVLGRTLAEAQSLRPVTQELLRAERLLSANYEGAPYLRPNQDKPLELASVVTLLASWTQRAHRDMLERQQELAGQLTEPDMDLAAVQAERDMLTKARDAQAAELRALRDERDDLRQIVVEREAATAQNVELSRRVAELEAELEQWQDER